MKRIISKLLVQTPSPTPSPPNFRLHMLSEFFMLLHLFCYVLRTRSGACVMVIALEVGRYIFIIAVTHFWVRIEFLVRPAAPYCRRRKKKITECLDG